MPRSVLTTSTILHSSVWPGNSAGAVSSSELSSESSSSLSLESSFSVRLLLPLLLRGEETALPPKRPSDFAWPMK